MKKTYVWVYVVDPGSQSVNEVYGPCNEQMMAQINEELTVSPLTGFPENTAEVLCSVRYIAPNPVYDPEFTDVLYIPGYFDCSPVKPFRLRKIQRALVPRY
jgi:hypothetical protein